MSPMSPRLLRPRATGFNPRSISGLAGWWDASRTTSFAQNSDGTLAVSSGGPIGYWADLSGNNAHMQQATTNLRPTLTAAGINLRPSVSVPSVSNAGFGSVPRPTASPDATVFIVARFTPGVHWLSFDADGGTRIFDAAASDSSASPAISAGSPAYRVNRSAVQAARNVLASAMGNNTPYLLTASSVNFSSWGASWRAFAYGSSFQFSGLVAECVIYSRALQANERDRVEGYLASKWGIPSAPTASNADAQSWIDRVYANGGTVSTSTAAAVNTFCNDIESAGIRDRFYRLNLFCGTGLSAALVPLYRGQSRTGTQFGGTTDTNNNFVSGDYVETGTTGGLQGNGSSKFLNTGLPMNFSPLRNYHLSAMAGNFTTNNAGMIGVDTNGDGTSPRFFQALVSFNATPRVNVFYNIGTNFVQPSFNQTYTAALLLGSGNASGNTLYANGSSVGTDGESGAGTTANTYPLFVFAVNNRNVNVLNYANCRISAYSAGAHMTASQVSAYNSALAAFRTAMGRA
jgi:hypothetical protein